MFLCVYPQLHFFNSLPQEEELFGLPLILGMEAQEVLLCHFLRGNGLASEAGVIGLEELVEIALDSELILQSLDGALKMLVGGKRGCSAYE